ncbi:energy-coupling factor transporter transmembrane component T family protein [Crenobacter caeni]|uniref:Energy-coupling factor transporter transmembrane protein EcfT n=1 Tax=Crenobacter caeni TaxID=2705474 RepID=A0A6B2KTN9_9NEIS|nr:energy-coupling factor transporter transmembrane component T [Crenobacter caeni]NDV13501.1 energy-coupling factor transporter transmembrane protein EcfT [Crenobacter caeni]
MHPFTGFALLPPLLLLTLRLTDARALAALLVVLLVLVWMGGEHRVRLRRWALLMLPLAAGLWLVHGRYLDSLVFGADVADRPQRLYAAALLWLRVGCLLAGAQVALRLAPPARLTRALFASRLPPSVAYLLASPLLLSVQLRRRLAEVTEAQRARGVDPAAPWPQRARTLIALAGPLVVWTLSDVGERANALDARAFRSVPCRTTLDAPAFTARDRALLAAALAAFVLVAGSWLWR